jgi:hypothetical protein
MLQQYGLGDYLHARIKNHTRNIKKQSLLPTNNTPETKTQPFYQQLTGDTKIKMGHLHILWP